MLKDLHIDLGQSTTSSPVSDCDDMLETEEEKELAEFMRPHIPKDLSSLQLRFYHFFEFPQTPASKLFCSLLLFAIIATCAIALLQSAQVKVGLNGAIADSFCLVIFIVDYVGRLIAHRNKVRFILKGWNVIDIIGMIGFIEYLLPQEDLGLLHFMRLLKSVRLVRVISCLHTSAGLQVAWLAVLHSFDALFMITVYLAIMMLLSSTCIYYLERGFYDQVRHQWLRTLADGRIEISPFQSVIHSMWWSIVTLTTTGYGDSVPITPGGKCCSALVQLAGITLIALPTSIIGSNFSNELQTYQRVKHNTRHRTQTEKSVILNQYQLDPNERLRLFKQENVRLNKCIEEVQRVLSDITQPHNFYQQSLDIKAKAEAMEKRIAELDKDNQTCIKMLQRFDLEDEEKQLLEAMKKRLYVKSRSLPHIVRQAFPALSTSI